MFHDYFQDDPQYGTIQMNNTSMISHADLVFFFRNAFEAMSKVEYKQKHQDTLFNSPLIEKLKHWHQQNIRIQPIDFKQIPLLCIPSMLKHSWIFDNWDNSQILNAIHFSLETSNKSKKLSNQMIILLQSIKRFHEIGGVMYPFDR
eukprot:91407_1